ncbi:MAG: Fe-Mn family superoxide dismutase [Patescibacteria group bacterium]
MNYQEKTFDFGTLDGFSEKQISEHLKLYAGYVKNVNRIETEIGALMADSEKNALSLSEIKRRLGFEWNGMRLHELYFDALGHASGLDPASGLSQAIEKRWGSVDELKAQLKAIGLMRGIGWVLLVNDRAADMLQTVWVGDHEVGHLAGTEVLLAMDVWEHAYAVDYLPTGRAAYIDAFMKNLNWGKVAERFN